MVFCSPVKDFQQFFVSFLTITQNQKQKHWGLNLHLTELQHATLPLPHTHFVSKSLAVLRIALSAKYLPSTVQYFPSSLLCLPSSILCFSLSELSSPPPILCFSSSVLSSPPSILCFPSSVLCSPSSILCFSSSVLCFPHQYCVNRCN